MRFNDDVWGIIKLYFFPKHLWTLPENKHFFRTMKELPKINQISSMNQYILIRNPTIYMDDISFVKVYELLCWDYKSQINRLFIESYTTINNNIDLLYLQSIPPLLVH